jgi:hypothetical protein
MGVTHILNHCHQRLTCKVKHVEVGITCMPHFHWHNMLSWRVDKYVVVIEPPLLPEVAACIPTYTSLLHGCVSCRSCSSGRSRMCVFEPLRSHDLLPWRLAQQPWAVLGLLLLARAPEAYCMRWVSKGGMA